MGEPLKSRHIRLCPEADKILVAIADLQEKDAAEMGRILLEEVLLGRKHTLMLVTERVQRVVGSGTRRE